MKLAIFMPQFSGGGAEKIMIMFANYLVDLQGCSVTIVVANDRGPYKSLVDSRIRIHALNHNKVFFAVFDLYRFLRQENFEFVYSTLMKANLISIVACLFLPTKAIIREANTLKEARRKAVKLSVKFSLFLSQYLYKYAFKCIAISNHVQKDLVEFTNCNLKDIEVIYNPIFIVDNIEHPQLNLREFNVCFVSRLTVQKNITTICEVIEYFLKNNLEVHFHFFGDGDEKEKLLLLKQNYNTPLITLHGFNVSYYSYMKHMNLFVHIPHWEGLGNSVLEAYNSGIPMILSDISSGYSELISKEASNVHFVKPVHDVQKIILLISSYMNNSSTAQQNRPKLNMSKEDIFASYLNLTAN